MLTETTAADPPRDTVMAPVPSDPSCRLCGARLTRSLIDLGRLPLTNRTVPAGTAQDATYPLHARVCDACSLIQIPDVAPPSTVAAPRPFLCSRSNLGRTRAARFADRIRKRLHLDDQSLVIEVGSNDGTLLRAFRDAGVRVLGIESAPHPATTAIGLGIPTEPRPFDAEFAMEIAVRHGRADLVIVNHVLHHTPDLFDFAAGLACILRPNGVLSLAVPYVLSILRTAEFDAFRHDTYTYLSLRVLEHLMRSVGLRVFDAERLPDHGGSLRIAVCHANARHPDRPGLAALRRTEAMGDQNRKDLTAFPARVAAARAGIQDFLHGRRIAGRRVAGYGASARGGMLLNVCGVTAESIDRIADPDASLQGSVLPGCRLPIVPISALLADCPDDVLILSWPTAADALVELAPLRQRGVHLWTPLPRLARV